jgi:hypothetical protein
MGLRATLFTAALAAILAAGCGKSGPETNTVPFRQAVNEYLANKSMDMTVAEFESLEVDGDVAEAMCKLEAADDLYGGVGVHWSFTFRHEDDAWRVESHRRK